MDRRHEHQRCKAIPGKTRLSGVVNRQAEGQAFGGLVRIVDQRRPRLAREGEVARDAEQGAVRAHKAGNAAAFLGGRLMMADNDPGTGGRGPRDRRIERVAHPFVGHQPGRGPRLPLHRLCP